MDASSFKSSIVALACWRAAPFDLHQAQLAVCQVFMNRAKEGWFDGDLYENCFREGTTEVVTASRRKIYIRFLCSWCLIPSETFIYKSKPKR